MSHVKKIASILSLCLLTGCMGSLDGLTKTASMENIPTCEIAPPGKARAYVNSMFGWLGISFRLTDASAQVICAPSPKVTPPP